jgi:PAS domain S-box-containing protein
VDVGVLELADAVDACVVGLDRRGRIRIWNRYAERAIGRSVATVLGKPLSELLDSERARDRLAEALLEAAGGTVVTGLELGVRGADGAQCLVRWSLRGLERDATATGLILATGEDLTGELEVRRRAAEVEALSALSALTTGLAHEIRNPLTAAVLQLELLRRAAEGSSTETLRDAVGRRVVVVREELLRLTKLLDDFLALAKPRALSLRQVAVCEVVEEVVTLRAADARSAGVEIDVAGDRLQAMADRSLLKQALDHLVANAIDAMRPCGRGRLAIRCHSLGERRIEISVEDDGPGIPREVAHKVLAPFVTTKEAGTGLGLTIVKRAVDRHGGTLSISSVPERGTAVRFTLERC